MDALPSLTPERWLETIGKEYLSDYIRSGGSAVKVVSGTEAQIEMVTEYIGQMAAAGEYYYAHLDASKRTADGKRPDLHRIDRFFLEATREIDWAKWADQQARQYLAASGVTLVEDRDLGDIDRIAEDNGRDAQDLVNQYQRELATPQIRDPRLSIEFRTAITALGRALLIPDSVTPTAKEVLLDWFKGRSSPSSPSALKKVQIYERIAVSNARPLLASFCRWLPRSGYSGLVVTLDFRPYEFKRMAKGRRQEQQLRLIREAVARGASSDELVRLAADDSINVPDVFYSDAAYMQMLTIIRRFIDEIDAFERFLLVILTSPNFYKDKSSDTGILRCYYDYDALQTRIGQEVHDARYANPAAALVHLEVSI